MPVTKSPLRYPGGKTQLSEFVAHTLISNEIFNGVYCEPFSGGAGLALELLNSKKVSRIILNDIDIGIYSIWHAILNDTDLFTALIKKTEVTIKEWHNQKAIHTNHNCDKSYSLEMGFATFFLNRTNRSGIISGGPIGGYNQLSKDKLNCRFNKDKLLIKINNIAAQKENIQFYNMDAIELIDNVLINQNFRDLFIFFDPPYYKQGKKLYTNFYTKNDHIILSEKIKSLNDYYWITTYDIDPNIKDMYKDTISKEYLLNYSANGVRKEKEYLFHNSKTKIESWDKVKFEK